MEQTFGQFLKTVRLRAGFGLRTFAEMVEWKPSNLSAVEHGRRNPPSDGEKLQQIAEALGLTAGSDDWACFFDLASQVDSLPPDLRHLASRKPIPALLRTIHDRQLSDAAIEKLIRDIEHAHGG